MKHFVIAVMTFTRIPIPYKWFSFSLNDLSKSMAFFPLIGALVGGICMVLFHFLQNTLSENLLIFLLLVISTAITGAFHEDGFADYCDSYGGYSKEKRLEIMKDSRIGTFGTVGVVFLLLAKVFLLQEIIFSLIPLSIITALIIGRFCTMPILKYHHYIVKSCHNKKIGFAENLVNFSYSTLGIAFLITVGVLSIWLPIISIIAILIPTQIILFIISFYFSSRLGGITGDAGGAIEQIGEVFTYILFLAYGNILI